MTRTSARLLGITGVLIGAVANRIIFGAADQGEHHPNFYLRLFYPALIIGVSAALICIAAIQRSKWWFVALIVDFPPLMIWSFFFYLTVTGQHD